MKNIATLLFLFFLVIGMKTSSQTWEKIQGIDTEKILSIYSDQSNLIIGTEDSGAYKQVSGDWIKIGLKNTPINSIILNDSVVTACTNEGLFKLNNSNDWLNILNKSTFSLNIKNNGYLIAGTNEGAFYGSSYNWKYLSGGGVVKINSILTFGINDIYATSEGLLFCDDDTLTFMNAGGNMYGVIHSLSMFAGNLFSGGDIGIGYSSDAGASWSKIDGFSFPVYCLVSNDTYLFAGTDNGVFVSANGSDWYSIGLDNIKISSLNIHGNEIFAGTYLSGLYLSQITTIGIKENEIKYEAQFFPNPASNYIIVRANAGDTISILNALGLKVFEKRLLYNTERINFLLPNGIYFVSAVSSFGTKNKVRRLIIR